MIDRRYGHERTVHHRRGDGRRQDAGHDDPLPANYGRSGVEVSALKPVVSGFDADDPASDPALHPAEPRASTPTATPIASISPWRFAAPISPASGGPARGPIGHAGGGRADSARERVRVPGPIRLIEGAGGVMSPILRGCDLPRPDRRARRPGRSSLPAPTWGRSAIRSRRSGGSGARPIARAAGSSSPNRPRASGLAETIDGLRQFGGGEVPIYPLPRLAGEPGDAGRAAPNLLALCEADDE